MESVEKEAFQDAQCGIVGNTTIVLMVGALMLHNSPLKCCHAIDHVGGEEGVVVRTTMPLPSIIQPQSHVSLLSLSIIQTYAMFWFYGLCMVVTIARVGWYKCRNS